MTRRTNMISIVIVAVLGMAAVWYATARGVGVFSDSVVYLDGAVHILHGQGFASSMSGAPVRIVQFMPFFSAAVAAVGWMGLPVAMAARVLNTALFGLNILLAAWLVAKVSPRHSVWPLVGALCVALSERLVDIHARAWTEPLFIALMLLSIGWMIRFRRRWRYDALMLSALAVALACLDRYVGVALIGAGGLVLLAARERAWRERLLATATYGLIAALPVLLWMMNNWNTRGSATNRQLAWHPVSELHWRQLVETVGSYLGGAPLRWGLVAAVIALALLALGGWLYVQLRRDGGAVPSRTIAVSVLALYAASYFGVLLFSISALDESTQLSVRQLSSLFVPLLVLALAGLQVILAKPGARRATWIALVVVGFVWWAARQAYGTQAWVRWAHNQGLGFYSVAWADSEVLPWLRALPADTLVITTEPRGIYFLTGRAVMWLPYETIQPAGTPNARYAAELERVRQRMQEGAVLVYLQGAPDHYADEGDLVEQLGLRARAELAGGTVYELDSRSP